MSYGSQAASYEYRSLGGGDFGSPLEHRDQEDNRRSMQEWRARVFNSINQPVAGPVTPLLFKQNSAYSPQMTPLHIAARRASDGALSGPPGSVEEIVEEVSKGRVDILRGVKGLRFLLFVADVLIFTNATLGFALAVVNEEVLWANQRVHTPGINSLKLGILASTFLLLVGIIARAFIKFHVLLLNQLVLRDESFFTQFSLLKTLVCELLVCVVAPLPYINTMVTIYGTDYSLDSVITVPMMLRLYLLARLIKNKSKFSTQKAKMFGKLVNIKPDGYGFTFKHHLRQNPLFTMTFINIAAILVFSYALHIYERPIDGTHADYWNAVWLTVITMTTVGYGDIYPQTFMGRCVAICCAYSATVIVALWVVAVHSKCMMNAKEAKLADTLTLLSDRTALRDNSARCVQNVFKFSLARKRGAKSRQQWDFKKKAWKYAQAAAELRERVAEESFENDPGFIQVEGYSVTMRVESRMDQMEQRLLTMSNHVLAMNRTVETLLGTVHTLNATVVAASLGGVPIQPQQRTSSGGWPTESEGGSPALASEHAGARKGLTLKRMLGRKESL